MLVPNAEGQPAASIKNHKAGENIKPFPGDCQTTHKPCDPQTPIPWIPGESSALFPSLVPLVSESSVLMCTKGYGVIQIMDPGQSTVQVDAPSSGEECKPPPEPGFFESLLDDLMMTGVANAPGPNDCTVGNESTAKQALDFALLVAPVKVGVANKALKGTTNTGNRARRAAATGAVTLQMGALRYGRAGRGAVRAGRNRARYAAYQLHAFLVKHEIEPGASGDLSSKDPKKRGKLFLLQKAIKEAIKIAAG